MPSICILRRCLRAPGPACFVDAGESPALGAVDPRTAAQCGPAELNPRAPADLAGPGTPHSCIDAATTGGDVGPQHALPMEIRPTP